MDFGNVDLYGPAFGHERSRSVTGAGLKRTRAAMSVSARRLASLVRRMRGVPF